MLIISARMTLLVMALFLGLKVQTQEMLGIINSNYAGSNSALINPGMLLNSKLYSDINILTADVFFDNNFLYIHREDYKLNEYLRKDAKFPKYGDDDQPFDYYRNNDLKHIYSSIRAIGPSAFVVYNDWAFAVQTQVRTILSGYRMPGDIAVFGYEGLNYPPQFNIHYNNKDMVIGEMTWGEINVSVAKTIYHYGFDKWTVGGTLKYLMGYAGAFIKANNINYIVYNDTTTNILNLDAQAGFSLPVNYSDNAFFGKPTFKGKGVGVDLGITYIRTRKGHSNKRYRKLCEQEFQDYIYSIGFSILDLGAIRFKDNAQLHEFNNVNHYWERIDTLSFSNIHALADELSTRFYGNPTASLSSTKFSIGLPTALSLQFDYHHYKNWFFNALVIYPIRLNNTYLVRPPQVAITPRYESKDFEVSMPVSLYNLQKLRLGLAARYCFLTVGTDKLGSFFGFSDFTGLDIYFSVKINLRKGWCGFGKKFTECPGGEYSTYSKKRR